jgi:hypothetical protein
MFHGDTWKGTRRSNDQLCQLCCNRWSTAVDGVEFLLRHVQHGHLRRNLFNDRLHQRRLVRRQQLVEQDRVNSGPLFAQRLAKEELPLRQEFRLRPEWLRGRGEAGPEEGRLGRHEVAKVLRLADRHEIV